MLLYPETARHKGHFLFIRSTNSHPLHAIRCRHSAIMNSAYSLRQITHTPSFTFLNSNSTCTGLSNASSASSLLRSSCSLSSFFFSD